MEIQKKQIIVRGAKYTIYSNGRIVGALGKDLKHRRNDDGYAVVTMGSKKEGRRKECVHRLVAKYFLDNPNHLPEVDHKDNNRMNPDVHNLEWVTHEENIKRAYERGSHVGRAVGEKNPRARLTDELVLLMRKLYKEGVTIQEMVEKYSYPWNTIGNAVKGITWKHLPL